MKLRCTENSIRIRVKKSDLQCLADEGKVVESIQFLAGNYFYFELAVAEVTTPQATLEKNSLCVKLPEKQANHWINSQQVGIEYHQKLEGKATLHLLIEKDFPCKDRADEDKSDTFQELVSDEGETC